MLGRKPNAALYFHGYGGTVESTASPLKNPIKVSQIEPDHPIALLTRKSVLGDRMLVAFVHLTKGCNVERHRHESEQIAIIRSGSVRWTIGEEDSDEYQVFMARAGDVVVLRSNVIHGVDAEEDTEIIDVLTPIGPMGVDAHR